MRKKNFLCIRRAISRAIVEAHDGELTLRSSEGIGTTACMVLPFASTTPAVHEKTPRSEDRGVVDVATSVLLMS